MRALIMSNSLMLFKLISDNSWPVSQSNTCWIIAVGAIVIVVFCDIVLHPLANI